MGVWESPFDHGGVLPQRPPGLDPVPPLFPLGNFLALHASLIPKGPNRGKVLVWSHIHYNPSYGPPSNETRALQWSIVDADADPPQFQNFEIALPEGQGDLFCAGHAWNGDGDLLVAGGTLWHGDAVQGWTGARLMYLYRSNTNTWENGSDLDEGRWYPSVVNLGKALPPAASDKQDRLMVAGGSKGSGGSNGYMAVSSYQVWVPDFLPPSGTPTGRWQPNSGSPPPNQPFTFAGPLGGYPYELWDYPRLHLLSNGVVASAGFRPGTARINHYLTPGLWSNFANLQAQDRSYNSSFLFPYVLGSPSTTYDVIVSTGGWDWPSNQITNNVQMSKATAGPGAWPGGHDWTTACANPPTQCPHGNLLIPRWCHNTVVLPDATAMVFGGEQQEAQRISCSEAPALHPEQLVNGVWKLMTPTHIIRNYHSTALLLPSGRVLTAGGEYRKYHPVADCSNPNPTLIAGPSDYQVFQPPYISLGQARPQILHPLPPSQHLVVAHGSKYTVSYNYLPMGVSVTKVVLMRPGSVTHHADVNQRHVEIEFTHVPMVDPPALEISIPSTSELLPPGYYMLFLVTNQGVPSEAGWVHVL